LFDVLLIDGEDLRQKPWSERRRRLARLMVGIQDEDAICLSEVWADGAALLRACGEQKLEGIVSKPRTSTYRSGPTDAWTKTKVRGWTESNRGRFRT
jgi:ATP-dependent DNA ligase